MIHDHDPDYFHLDLATYLGADPDLAANITCEEVSRLGALRDGGSPATAIAQAEGLVVACLAFLGSMFGPQDVADALLREAARQQRKADRDATVIRLVEEGKAR